MATQALPRTFPPIAKLAADGRAQLIEHVDQEIAGLKMELATLQETRRALTGRNGTTEARPGNGERHATRQRSRTSGGRDVTEDTVLEAIRTGMGDQSPALARALRATPDLILRRLKALETKGFIRREGERANTRWVISQATG